MRQTTAIAVGHPAVQIAHVILSRMREKGDPITPMQLLKLVFLAHGWMLGIHSRPLISDAVEAWPYGPVVPSVYHEFKVFGGGFIDCEPRANVMLSPAEDSIIQQVCDIYGSYTGMQLSTLTHQSGSPWHRTRQLKGHIISPDMIEDYYRRLAQGAPARG